MGSLKKIGPATVDRSFSTGDVKLTPKTSVQNTLDKTQSTYVPKAERESAFDPLFALTEAVVADTAAQGPVRLTLPTASEGLLRKAAAIAAQEPQNVGRELAFARRARSGADTVKALQKQQDAYLEQHRATRPRNTLDDVGWGSLYNSGRIAGGFLNAVEKPIDAIGSGFWNAVGTITSFNNQQPNALSDYAFRQADAFLEDDVTGRYKQSVEERYKPADAHRKLGDLSETVAAMLPSIAAASATGGASALGTTAPKVAGADLGRTLMGLQAAGGAATEAKQEGASTGEALLYGATSGLLETTIESVAGGIPGLGTGKATELVSKVVSNPVVRRLVDAAGEGGEEALSTIITPYIKRAIYDPEAENATLDEIAQSAVMGMVASGVLQAGVEIPAAISNRVDAARQARQNVADPEFLLRTAREATEGYRQQNQRNESGASRFQSEATSLGADGPLRNDTPLGEPGGSPTGPIIADPTNGNPNPSQPAQGNRQGVQVPIEERTWQDAGNRKVNAFQYDHPELRPYYAEAAQALKYDLAGAVRGERVPVQDQEGYITGYTGTKREVSGPLAHALDDAKLSYAQISKALDDLIADHGQENYAAAKKVELVLDEMLAEGYTDSDGYAVPPNAEYLRARERVNAGVSPDSHEFRMSEEEWASLMGQEAPDPLRGFVDNAAGTGYDGGNQNQTGGADYGRGEEAPAAGEGIFGADVRGEAGGTKATLSGRVGTVLEEGGGRDQAAADWAKGHIAEQPSETARLAVSNAGRYMTDVFSVNDAAIKARDPKAWALTSEGKIYISDSIPAELADVVGYHEVVHAVRQLNAPAYQNFLLQEYSAFNRSAKETQRVLDLVVKSRFPGKDIFDLTPEEAAIAYDELNAVVWGYYKADPENARAQFAGAFLDYDAYIQELDAIMEGARQASGLDRSAGAAPDVYDLLGSGSENLPEIAVGANKASPWTEFVASSDSFFPEGANAARDVDVPTKDPMGRNIRKTAATAMGAKAIPDEVVGDIQKMVLRGELSYNKSTDKASIDRAVRKIETKTFPRALEEFSAQVRKGVVSKDLVTLGQQLLINAANAGDADATAEILSLYAQVETTAGQAVQAASILRKLSPTAQLHAAKKAVSELEETLKKSYKDLELTIDPDLIDEFEQQTTQEGRDAVLEKIKDHVAAQVPSKWQDKWNALRYMAMLANPRTHSRNILGNTGFQPLRWIKDRVAAAIEAGVSKASGGKLERTKSFTTSPELYKAAWADWKNVRDALSGNRYDDIKKEIDSRRTIFKNNGTWGTNGKGPAWLLRKASDIALRGVEAVRKWNSWLLEMEDVIFKRITYADALAGYLNAHGVTAEQMRNKTVDTQLLSKARDYAGQEALKATYQDRNVVSDYASQIGRGPNTPDPVRVVTEGVLPFRRTPANILLRGLEYSPLGLAKGLTYDLVQVKRGKMTGAEAIDHIASGLTGSSLFALGMYLFAQGIVTSGGGDDEGQDAINDITGVQNYALNLPGGGNATLDWLAPEALPFFMGVELMESIGENGFTIAGAMDAAASAASPLLELSMLQSLNDLIDSVSFADSTDKVPAVVGSALISYFTQALPTVLGQAERSAQDVRMTTYTDKNLKLPTDIQYALGKASAKIPGWDYQQMPYIDAWGRRDSSGPLWLRTANNFLNPAYTSNKQVTPVDAEIQRLYDRTGGKSIVPSRPERYITVNKKRVDLSKEQYERYATNRGQTQFKMLERIIQNPAYRDMSDKNKTTVIESVYEYANETAKADISNYALDGWVKNAAESQLDPEDFILFHTAILGIESDKDENGETIRNSKKKKVLKFIDKMDVSNSVKDDYYYAAGYEESTIRDAPWH